VNHAGERCFLLREHIKAARSGNGSGEQQSSAVYAKKEGLSLG